jgi:hypothetical protein
MSPDPDIGSEQTQADAYNRHLVRPPEGFPFQLIKPLSIRLIESLVNGFARREGIFIISRPLSCMVL